MLGVRRVLGLTALLVALVSGLHVASPGAAPAAPAVVRRSRPRRRSRRAARCLPGGTSALEPARRARASAKARGSSPGTDARSARASSAARSARSTSSSPGATSSGSERGSSPTRSCRGTARQRPFEQPNQPLYVRVVVPRGRAPGTYAGRVVVSVDGRPIPIPALRPGLRRPRLPERPLPTSFHVSPATYL